MKFKLTAVDLTYEMEHELGIDWVEGGSIEINSLEELMKFIGEWGEIIIWDVGEIPEIEIYNGYRE